MKENILQLDNKVYLNNTFKVIICFLYFNEEVLKVNWESYLAGNEAV